FQIGPTDPPRPARADRLQDRLLRGPTTSEMLDRVLARLAVADLLLRIHSAQEQLAVLLDHLADARALDDIGADSQNEHTRTIRMRWGPRRAVAGSVPKQPVYSRPPAPATITSRLRTA